MELIEILEAGKRDIGPFSLNTDSINMFTSSIKELNNQMMILSRASLDLHNPKSAVIIGGDCYV